MTAPETPETEGSPALKAWTFRIILAMLLGGVVVGIAYMQRNRYEANSPRPPYITKIERDLEAISADGSTFQLSSMKGKVYLAALVSAQPGVTADALVTALTDIGSSFAGREDFGVVVFSATPEKDTPEAMTEFGERHHLPKSGWHFLTADPETLTRYVKRYFRLHPVMPQNAAGDTAEPHDTRVVLVDRKANIRGYYRVVDPEHGQEYRDTLRTHLTYVLDNP